VSTSTGKKILHYEDQPEAVEAIHSLLENKLNLDLTKATSPKEVHEILAGNCFDLILLDIRIFSNDAIKKQVDWTREGLYFLQKLRKGDIPGPTRAEVPVLVLTAVVNTADHDKILEVGTSNGSKCLYITKPAHLDTVEKAVMELLKN